MLGRPTTVLKTVDSQQVATVGAITNHDMSVTFIHRQTAGRGKLAGFVETPKTTRWSKATSFYCTNNTLVRFIQVRGCHVDNWCLHSGNQGWKHLSVYVPNFPLLFLLVPLPSEWRLLSQDFGRRQSRPNRPWWGLWLVLGLVCLLAFCK